GPTQTVVLAGTTVPAAESQPKQNQPQHKEFTYTINCQQHSQVDKTNFIARLPAKPKKEPEKEAVQLVKQPQVDMQLEEVAPLAMTEVKDNDGDNSVELWQDGGRSRGGTGATSSLAEYLKELHKKLKRTWSPPPGPVRHIKVLFRLTN